MGTRVDSRVGVESKLEGEGEMLVVEELNLDSLVETEVAVMSQSTVGRLVFFV
jgi:hypothetical protein